MRFGASVVIRKCVFPQIKGAGTRFLCKNGGKVAFFSGRGSEKRKNRPDKGG